MIRSFELKKSEKQQQQQKKELNHLKTRIIYILLSISRFMVLGPLGFQSNSKFEILLVKIFTYL